MNKHFKIITIDYLCVLFVGDGVKLGHRNVRQERNVKESKGS
jgi:hypothetical protein